MKVFKKEDLKLCDFQYQIIHENVNDFEIGEEVFLKSNPEYSLKVYSFGEKKVVVGEYAPTMLFPPQCILQYKYSGLIIWKRKYEICIN